MKFIMGLNQNRSKDPAVFKTEKELNLVVDYIPLTKIQ